MKRYDKYKYTGIEWIGEIPEHWDITRLKYTANKASCCFIDGDWIESTDLSQDGIKYITTGNIGVLKYKEQGDSYISEETFKRLNCTEVFEGDIIISRLNEPIGRSCILPNLNCRVVTSVDNVILRPDIDTYNKQYLVYWLNSKRFTENANLIARGATMHRISRNMLGHLSVIVPSLSEQEAIANYLDEKCGCIDKIIATQEKRVALLNELKQSVISEAVTRGINPDAPLIATGIEWIGEIPEYWEVKRLRFVCEFRNGYTPSKANPDFWEDGTIPWYRMEDIRDSGRFLNEAKQYVTEEAVKGAGLFEAESFILATTATIGEHAMLIVDSLANQQFTNLKIRKSLVQALNKDFFFYYLYVVDDFCKSSTRTATFPAMNMEDLKNFGVTLPPIKEQEKIVEYLNAKTTSIDTLISKANKEIELLNEYKQLIITEAVTGKIKVC